MSLTKEQILAADDIKRVKVSVPEWGGEVWVQSLLASRREELAAIVNKDTKRVSFTKLLAMTLVDENGVSLGFTDDDVAGLENKSLAAIVRVGVEALKINGMTPEAVEEAVKNSDPSQS